MPINSRLEGKCFGVTSFWSDRHLSSQQDTENNYTISQELVAGVSDYRLEVEAVITASQEQTVQLENKKEAPAENSRGGFVWNTFPEVYVLSASTST
ncbi:hypothetical protein Bpfe_020388 [Biomphalaria pfeifferi]|uniref:Uncharacterized protein n=1 Tax=Biomphalaria pfeifferi TaxID=112525 RepID=A0AAD8B8R3_BIOPF|nr:hypothetical protein Bpfe_020388 [Biomphalaria pfeifferi]